MNKKLLQVHQNPKSKHTRIYEWPWLKIFSQGNYNLQLNSDNGGGDSGIVGGDGIEVEAYTQNRPRTPPTSGVCFCEHASALRQWDPIHREPLGGLGITA